MKSLRARDLLLLFVVPTALAAVPHASVPVPSLSGSLRVDAGPDRFVVPPATSVTLDATVHGVRLFQSAQPGSAPGVPQGVSYSWVQLAGPTVDIKNSSTLRPTLHASRAGTVRLRLKAITATSTDSDEVLVTFLGNSQDAEIAGEPRKWNKLALTFHHDQVLSETSTPNPFLDLRLAVYFFNLEEGATHVVPGFFAADGNAAETSATSGDCWRVNFTPDHAGTWYYLANFRSGSGIALDPDLEVGTSVSFDNGNGTFHVAPADPDAAGFLSKGRLDYVGGHHLRFAETGEYYLKGGAGSPENFLAYYEIDGTADQGGTLNGLNQFPPFDGLHHFDEHLADYQDLGVPLWKNGKGRRIFGALNYLASRGVDSLYALSYNLDGGDGQDVWPWAQFDHLRFDVSKLAQWERVLDHMNRAGIAWHVITQENENDHALDGGELGTERKLYYRELIARFGYANGLVWNLGEENTNTPEQRRDFADYIRALDTNAHPIALHNIVGDISGTFGTLLGTHLEVLSLQGHPINTPPRLRQLVTDSEAAGRPWVVNFDEQTPASDGVVPDAFDFWHDVIRTDSLWPTLLGDGGGCEWYFGYNFPHDDLDCEDFRSRDNLWLLTTRACDFLRAHVPFERMEHAIELATGADPSVFAERGEHYLVYLPSAGPSTLDLEGYAEPFTVSWFDGRDGGPLQDGDVTQVSGPGPVSLGLPPGAGDWVAWVRRVANSAPVIESVSVEPGVFEPGEDFALLVRARDPNGPTDALTVTAQFIDQAGDPAADIALPHRGGHLYSMFHPQAPPVGAGPWHVVVHVTDAGGLAATGALDFTAH